MVSFCPAFNSDVVRLVTLLKVEVVEPEMANALVLAVFNVPKILLLLLAPSVRVLVPAINVAPAYTNML